MGFSERGIRAAYYSKKTSVKNKSGEVYNFRWEEPLAPLYPKICHLCSKTLSFKDKSASFSMLRDNFDTHKLEFESISKASRRTGISINTLRNACEKTNPTITRRGSDPEKFWVEWRPWCLECISKKRENYGKQYILDF